MSDRPDRFVPLVFAALSGGVVGFIAALTVTWPLHWPLAALSVSGGACLAVVCVAIMRAFREP